MAIITARIDPSTDVTALMAHIQAISCGKKSFRTLSPVGKGIPIKNPGGRMIAIVMSERANIEKDKNLSRRGSLMSSHHEYHH
jgi:hypothetical protein